MDPNANLTELLQLARAISREEDRDRPPPQGYPERVAELVLALDEWIRGGGFLPAAWERSERS